MRQPGWDWDVREPRPQGKLDLLPLPYFAKCMACGVVSGEPILKYVNNPARERDPQAAEHVAMVRFALYTRNPGMGRACRIWVHIFGPRGPWLLGKGFAHGDALILEGHLMSVDIPLRKEERSRVEGRQRYRRYTYIRAQSVRLLPRIPKQQTARVQITVDEYERLVDAAPGSEQEVRIMTSRDFDTNGSVREETPP